MAGLTLYKGRNSPHVVAAYHEATNSNMKHVAEDIKAKAEAILESHHGRTRDRANNNPSPYITIEHYKLDWYVFLHAAGTGEENGDQRVIGIEYGHQYQSKGKNPSGPWGQSGGLHVLGRATESVALWRGL